MRARREYRDRDGTQVAVLDALVERTEEGMTIFELRAAVSVDIDELEVALADLKNDGLIVVDSEPTDAVIRPADRVVPETATTNDDGSIVDWLRRRFPF